MARLLGPDGQPLAKADFTRPLFPAGPALTGVRRRFRDSVATGLTPERLARLLRDAALGSATDYLTLAEEMEERSPHYAGVLGIRKRALIGLPYKLDAASDAPRDVELRDAVDLHLLKTPAFGRLKVALADALAKGYSAVEIRWDLTQTPWAPRDRSRQDRAYVWRDPRFFAYDDTGTELQLLGAGFNERHPLPPWRFVVHEPRLKMGVPIRGGLARLAAAHYLCAVYAQEDWLAFAEVYGMPVRLGRYGPGASPEDITKLIEAVSGLGSDAAAVIPDSMRIEFPTGLGSGNAPDLFERLTAHLEKQISKAVTGRSDTADPTAGKLGGEQFASEVRRDILESDAEELSQTLNEQLIQPFLAFNYGPQAAYPQFALYVPDAEDLTGLVAMLAALVPLGLKVEQSVIRDKWGLPEPAPDAEVLGAPAGAVREPPQPPPATNRAMNRAARPFDPTAAVDPLVARLGREAEPLLAALLEPVRAALDASADLNDFRDRVAGLYPDLDPSAFAELLGAALAVADAAGQATARDETT